MNKNLQFILDIVQQSESLNEERKISVLKALKDADKELEITAFKLDRTEKVKKTTAILLEETIEELEQKRKAVEAQNRELEIETALEKVRSSALSMKQPGDMLGVCKIISEQLEGLRVKEIRNVQTAIFYETKGIYLNYEFYSKHNKLLITEVDYKTHQLQELFANQMLKGAEELFTRTLEGDQLKDWYDYQKTTNQFADYYLEKAESLTYYWYSLGPVALGVSTYVPLSEEEINLFKRFRNVFELAYRRFLDIEQAVAQAREAQIEAALERVRSRSMGMQKSEELKEVIQVVYEQFVHLNIKIEHTGFVIDYKARDDYNIWIADPLGVPSQITVPYFDSVYYNRFNEAKEKGEDFFATNLTFEEKNKFYQKLFEYVPGLPEQAKEFYFSCPGLAASTVLLENVCLYIENFSGIPYSDEENATLMRFGKVFQQTYTRFLDLQKAEAQSKEFQIEAALEKVRSRTMAMQKSDELAETAAVLFQQLIILGIEPNRIYIAIIKYESGLAEFWLTDEDGSRVSTGFTANLNDHVVFQKMFKGWIEKKKSITIDMHGKELEKYFEYLNKLNVPFKGGLSQKRRVQNIAYFSKGFVGVASPDPQPEETIILLERFATVFNLTYTRFNDLQQAEEQNKIIQAENDRKTKELDDARNLQLAMLPRELPKLSNLEIAVYMKTATEVGGDYYDFHVGEDGTLTAVIGDATGHGMKAGTMVTITKSLFNSLASVENILDTYSKISQVIRDMKFRQLSMCLIMLKIKGKQLSISSAAMPPALIYRKKSKSIEEISIKGMPLGAMNNFPYSLEKKELEKGDTILLFTDGLPELKNDSNEMYGYDRTKTAFHSVGEKEPDEIIEHLKNSASQWANNRDPEDDITFVVIKLK